MKNRKIVIIGAGHVGSLSAFSLASQGVCEEIHLIDIDYAKAQAHAKDIADATILFPHAVCVKASEYNECDDADIVVISIGKSREPGQTRLDLLEDTIKMLKEVIKNLKKTAFNGIIISISNPADVVAQYLYTHCDYPKHKVFSTGTYLDTLRLKRTLAEYLRVDAKDIEAYSMGEHGNSSMIPFSQIKVGGLSLQVIDQEEVLSKTRNIGNEIIDGKNSTEFGIGYALSDLCKAIIYDEHRILPVSTYLDTTYHKPCVFAGVPCMIGREGIERVLEVPLNEKEQDQFKNTCEVIKTYYEKALTM